MGTAFSFGDVILIYECIISQKTVSVYLYVGNTATTVGIVRTVFVKFALPPRAGSPV